VIGLGLLFLVNGVQHLDGLLDFGDGLMFHGQRSDKLRVMADPATGAGGFALGLVIVLVTAFSLAAIPLPLIVFTVIVSETSATFAMVLATAAGKSAHEGMNVAFVEAMHRKRTLRLLLALLITTAISFLLLRLTGLIVVLASAITAMVVVKVSNRNFGGLTGDVLGAVHEIGRAVSVLLVLVFINWA
jgi:adenosylcobinamide-GDP ribazoletransferase